MNASSRAFSPVSASGPAERGPVDGGSGVGGINALFRLLAESWPGAAILLDRELSALWMNGQAGTLTGQSPGELAGVPWNELSLPWIAGAELRARLLTGERLHLEGVHDSGHRRLTGTLIPLQESGAEVSAVACLLREAAPRGPELASEPRLEAALESAQGEAVLRAVTRNTPDWLFLIDGGLVVRFVNRQFGPHPPATLVGQRLLDFVPEAHRHALQELYLRVFASGRPGQIELRDGDADGNSWHHEHRVVPVIEGGNVRSLTVAVTDVTERQSQQDAMRTQARILETMQEGVVLIDAVSGVVKLTNPMFARMFGYESEEELLGRSVESLFSTCALQLSPASGLASDTAPTEVLPAELECTRKDGARFVAACVFTPLRMGGASHWLAVLNDVTERKRLEREIIEISNREQQRIGSDLHDGLGQELTGIALMLKGVVAQLRKEGSATRSDIEDVITLVNNAVEGTRALARGLSPLSGERGVLAAALQALATRASQRYGVRVELDTDPDESLRLSETAATHVYRIVQEALTNVIRHSSASEVEIRLYASGGDLHLTVDDNGRGFSQPDPESPGGLGLKIMQYRTQMLGGDLMIDTGVRGGASIHCSFPMASP